MVIASANAQPPHGGEAERGGPSPVAAGILRIRARKARPVGLRPGIPGRTAPGPLGPPFEHAAPSTLATVLPSSTRKKSARLTACTTRTDARKGPQVHAVCAKTIPSRRALARRPYRPENNPQLVVRREAISSSA